MEYHSIALLGTSLSMTATTAWMESCLERSMRSTRDFRPVTARRDPPHLPSPMLARDSASMPPIRAARRLSVSPPTDKFKLLSGRSILDGDK